MRLKLNAAQQETASWKNKFLETDSHLKGTFTFEFRKIESEKQ